MSTEPSSRPAFIAASIHPTAHPLTLIHQSAWKGSSPKSRCRILHRSPSRATRMASGGWHAACAESTVVVLHEDAGRQIGPYRIAAGPGFLCRQAPNLVASYIRRPVRPGPRHPQKVPRPSAKVFSLTPITLYVFARRDGRVAEGQVVPEQEVSGAPLLAEVVGAAIIAQLCLVLRVTQCRQHVVGAKVLIFAQLLDLVPRKAHTVDPAERVFVSVAEHIPGLLLCFCHSFSLAYFRKGAG